jgi:hypothetical protein
MTMTLIHLFRRLRSTTELQVYGAAALLALLVGCGVPPGLEQSAFLERGLPSPRVIEALVTLPSDTGDQVVTIDLEHAQNSDRFSGDYQLGDVTNSAFFVDETSSFSYRYLGDTEQGVSVLSVSQGGGRSGGTMRWSSLLLLVVQNDTGLKFDYDSKAVRRVPRQVIRKIGEFSLDDRWRGEIKIVGNEIHVKADDDWFRWAYRGTDETNTVTIYNVNF